MSQPPVNANTQRIDLAEPDHVRFWIQHYGCTENELRAAVEAAGTVAQDVREFIAKRAKQALRNKSLS